jgi:hypothetical protein
LLHEGLNRTQDDIYPYKLSVVISKLSVVIDNEIEEVKLYILSMYYSCVSLFDKGFPEDLPHFYVHV